MSNITIKVFDQPSGTVAGFATLVSPSGKGRRVAHAYLLADGSVDLSMTKLTRLSLDGLKSQLDELAAFERQIRETEWSNHPPERA
ncbi:hypothetical protein VPH13_14040 [Stenotrophomonas pavanii]|uniref:hypothetical protein n=1 Tax=Stenotrophomonas pavanii TaxID=487698 RepID=UPI002DBEFB1A|nr:hypothetical protein [Stenotrophomonas pavanii]MEC4339842.1 hypothetical protein [Stenotrophomonas pavanii]